MFFYSIIIKEIYSKTKLEGSVVSIRGVLIENNYLGIGTIKRKNWEIMKHLNPVIYTFS